MAIRYVGASTPKAGADVNYDTDTGSTLQTALNAAEDGDTIWLEPGQDYTVAAAEQPFTLPTRASYATGIIVQPANWDDLALSSQVRIESEDDFSGLPRIVSNVAGTSCIQSLNVSSNWTFRGIVFKSTYQQIGAPAGAGSGVLLWLGPAAPTQLSQLPDNLTFDRCAVLGTGGVYPTWRGFVLHTKRANILGCWIDHIKGTGGLETQGIAGWNGVGPLRIEDNEIRACGISILLGGATRTIPYSNYDGVTIRRNHFYKRPEWWKFASILGAEPEIASTGWYQKNHIEFKMAKNCLIEGNIFENTWLSGDAGQKGACCFSSPSPDCAWAHVGDVTIQYNIAFNVGSLWGSAGGDFTAAESIYGPIGKPGNHVIQHNLAYRVDRKFNRYPADEVTYVGGRSLVNTTGRNASVVFRNNAAWGDGSEDVESGYESPLGHVAGFIGIETFSNDINNDADKHRSFIIENNILLNGKVFASGMYDGQYTMNVVARSWSFTNNLLQLEDMPTAFRVYTGNFYYQTPAEVEAFWPGDWRNGDMRFPADSDFAAGGAKDGTDGKALGPDYVALYHALGYRWPFTWTPDFSAAAVPELVN